MVTRKRSPRKGFYYARQKVVYGKTPSYIPESQPVKGASLAWPNHYTMMYRMAWGTNEQASYEKILSGAKENAQAWREWINSYSAVYGTRYAFPRLKADWKVLRLMIGLQERLMIEQIFSDMGRPYSQFVTGFGAII